MVVAAIMFLPSGHALESGPHAGSASGGLSRTKGAKLDDARFWSLIDAARSGAGDDHVFLARMTAVLGKLAPEELIEYERVFDHLHDSSYTWRLWGAAYLIGGGCSDDGFEYFRAWLIAQGRRVFERALANPDSLAEVAPSNEAAESEDFWYLARQVYAQKTGHEMPRAQGSRPALGEGWNFDDPVQMKRRYPKLWKKLVGR